MIEALVVLVQVLLGSTFALVPGQSSTALGAETLAVGAIAFAWCTRTQVHASRQPEQRRW